MRDRFKRFNSGRAVLFLVAIIAVFLTGAVLKFTAVIVLPFVIAVLLALVMTPLVTGLTKIKVPRFIAAVISGLIVIAGIWGLERFSFIRYSLFSKYIRVTKHG